MSDIEQQFFKVFGIEPIPIKSYGYWLIKGSIVENNKGEKVVYPEITDRKLLKMICIKSKDNNGYRISANNYKSLKEEILKDLIKTYSTYVMCTWEEERGEKFKHQIQQLFKE